jgi:hypothetical protein
VKCLDFESPVQPPAHVESPDASAAGPRHGEPTAASASGDVATRRPATKRARDDGRAVGRETTGAAAVREAGWREGSEEAALTLLLRGTRGAFPGRFPYDRHKDHPANTLRPLAHMAKQVAAAACSDRGAAPIEGQAMTELVVKLREREPDRRQDVVEVLPDLMALAKKAGATPVVARLGSVKPRGDVASGVTVDDAHVALRMPFVFVVVERATQYNGNRDIVVWDGAPVTVDAELSVASEDAPRGWRLRLVAVLHYHRDDRRGLECGGTPDAGHFSLHFAQGGGWMHADDGGIAVREHRAAAALFAPSTTACVLLYEREAPHEMLLRWGAMLPRVPPTGYLAWGRAPAARRAVCGERLSHEQVRALTLMVGHVCALETWCEACGRLFDADAPGATALLLQRALEAGFWQRVPCPGGGTGATLHRRMSPVEAQLVAYELDPLTQGGAVALADVIERAEAIVGVVWRTMTHRHPTIPGWVERAVDGGNRANSRYEPLADA